MTKQEQETVDELKKMFEIESERVALYERIAEMLNDEDKRESDEVLEVIKVFFPEGFKDEDTFDAEKTTKSVSKAFAELYNDATKAEEGYIPDSSDIEFGLVGENKNEKADEEEHNKQKNQSKDIQNNVPLSLDDYMYGLTESQAEAIDKICKGDNDTNDVVEGGSQARPLPSLNELFADMIKYQYKAFKLLYEYNNKG